MMGRRLAREHAFCVLMHVSGNFWHPILAWKPFGWARFCSHHIFALLIHCRPVAAWKPFCCQRENCFSAGSMRATKVGFCIVYNNLCIIYNKLLYTLSSLLWRPRFNSHATVRDGRLYGGCHLWLSVWPDAKLRSRFWNHLYNLKQFMYTV